MILIWYFKWKKKIKNNLKKVWFFLHFLVFLIIIRCLYYMMFVMKKIFWIMVALFAFAWMSVYATWWNFNDGTVWILDQVYQDSNKKVSNEVQNTDLDVVTSKFSECEWIAPDSRFSITRTMCSIKANAKNYLQYVMYVWLAAATVFLIWNGFKIVTSSEREKQLGLFKKNLLYIVVWVVLLTWFYYIIDIFVSVVNLIAE